MASDPSSRGRRVVRPRGSRRRKKAGLVGPIALAITLGAGIALAYDRYAPPPEHPLPSPGKVIKLDVGLGGCTDLSACATACDRGQGEKCRSLAISYALGVAPASKDETRATHLYERGCDLGDPAACLFAGQMYEYAHGVLKDDVRATGLYQRSCDAGWSPGCYNLAVMVEAGRGVPADRNRAIALYRGACSAGARQACEKVEAP